MALMGLELITKSRRLSRHYLSRACAFEREWEVMTNMGMNA